MALRHRCARAGLAALPLLLGLVIGLGGPTRTVAQGDSPQTLSAAEYDDERQLADLLWAHSPDVLEARTTAGVAASEVTRARTLPNPALDFTWGTIPIGRTNPSGLHDPLGNVPNYTTGISQLVELAKRGPRQAATIAEYERANAQSLATFADRFFELLGIVGRIAKSQLRSGVTDELVDASAQVLELDRARANKGDIAVMDLDRAEVEHLQRAAQTRDALVEAGRLRLTAASRRRQLLNARLDALEVALKKARGVRDALQAAQQRGGASMIDVLLARRAYQELLLDRIDLLGDAYDATLKVRQVTALFPRPSTEPEIRRP